MEKLKGWMEKLKPTLEKLSIKIPPDIENLWDVVEAMVDAVATHVTKKNNKEEEMLEFVSESFLVSLNAARNPYSSIGGYF